VERPWRPGPRLLARSQLGAIGLVEMIGAKIKRGIAK
jgi:hypothetical protein